jgi:hypothetical protein
MEIPSLSALTPEAVDRLYGLDRATPVAEPAFLFLVGAPGAGKSSGHAAAIEAGILPETRAYVTINLDLLLEAITAFRAASATAHLLKQKHRELVRFGSISAYASKKENLGLFKWYDDAREEIAAADPDTIAALNAVREVYRPLADAMVSHSIAGLSDAALGRAIDARVPIVCETTLSLSSASGRVTKIDALMKILAKTPYKDHVYMWHIKGTPDEIAARVRARQEYVMPADEHPFYRYVPAGLTRKFVDDTSSAFTRLQTQYAGKIQFHEISIPHDASRLPTAMPYNLPAQQARVIAAYTKPIGAVAPPKRRATTARRKKTPSSSSSSEKRKTAGRRKTPSSSSEKEKPAAAATGGAGTATAAPRRSTRIATGRR